MENEHVGAKRYIALALLAVYLSTAFGAAYASLTCACIWGTRTTEHAVCACGHSHGDSADAHTPCCGADAARGGDAVCGRGASDCAAAALSAPCCGDRHSTEIALYTDGASEEERPVRVAVSELLPEAAAVCPCPAHRPAMRRRAVDPPAPYVPSTELPAAGFRAPPASV